LFTSLAPPIGANVIYARPLDLVGKKLAKKIASGQTVKIQAQNGDGQITAEFDYTKP
jgi:hypothetical protein